MKKFAIMLVASAFLGACTSSGSSSVKEEKEEVEVEVEENVEVEETIEVDSVEVAVDSLSDVAN